MRIGRARGTDLPRYVVRVAFYQHCRVFLSCLSDKRHELVPDGLEGRVVVSPQACGPARLAAALLAQGLRVVIDIDVSEELCGIYVRLQVIQRSKSVSALLRIRAHVGYLGEYDGAVLAKREAPEEVHVLSQVESVDGSHDRFQLVARVEEFSRPEHAIVDEGVRPHNYRSDDTKVGPSTEDRPEEVRVRGGGDSDQLTGRGYQVGRDDVVHGQAVMVLPTAEATAECSSQHANTVTAAID